MKKRETAEKLIERLARDPEYQARRVRQEEDLAQRKRVYAADEADLVNELRELGYCVESVWDFVNNENSHQFLRHFDGRYDGAYPVLVKHLALPHHTRIREGIIRALTEKESNEVAAIALLREFEQESDPDLKWVLANALRTVLTRDQKRRYPQYKEVYNRKGKS